MVLAVSIYEKLRKALLSSPTASERGPVITGLSAVFFAVLAVFLVVLGSLAIKGTPFAF